MEDFKTDTQKGLENFKKAIQVIREGCKNSFQKKERLGNIKNSVGVQLVTRAGELMENLGGKEDKSAVLSGLNEAIKLSEEALKLFSNAYYNGNAKQNRHYTSQALDSFRDMKAQLESQGV